jgi:hypothetical protein
VEKQFDEGEKMTSRRRWMADQGPVTYDDSAPDPRRVTQVMDLTTYKKESEDQQLEHGKPLAHKSEKTATPHDICIKRRLFCMKQDVESMGRHFLPRSLTTITPV